MKRLAGLCFLFVALGAMASADQGRTIYVQFIRGTDQACTGANCREIGPKLSRKLSPVFRWKHFWEVDRKKLSVSKKITKMELPGDRKLEIQFTKADEIEVRLYRRTGLVTRTRHPTNNPLCVLGGEEENHESFFVVVRQDEPNAE